MWVWCACVCGWVWVGVVGGCLARSPGASLSNELQSCLSSTEAQNLASLIDLTEGDLSSVLTRRGAPLLTTPSSLWSRRTLVCDVKVAVARHGQDAAFHGMLGRLDKALSRHAYRVGRGDWTSCAHFLKPT